jgi:sec-independent protein translocase protein TatA
MNAGDSQMFDWKIMLVILAIVIVIFGTKRLRTIGSDLGASVKGFKEAISGSHKDEQSASISEPQTLNVHVASGTKATVHPEKPD